ncbi:MAG: hypothetical protein HKN27_17415 [Silicimonas sp.]|nr:hypothetical protein [Silicimonas sp.]
MSTWTSKALIAAFVFGLAGCEAGLGVSRKAPEQISLPDGLIVAGAEGWCVDLESSRAIGATSMVVLGSCAAIAKNAKAPRPRVPGVMTVSIEGAGLQAPPAAALEAFFETDSGLAVLARDGIAQSVRVLESRRDGEHLYLRAEDKSALPGAESEYWRAIFGLNGRLVSVTLLGLAGRPIAPAEGFATLQSQIEELIVANAV